MKTKLGERVEVEIHEARLARGWEGIEARAFVPARRVQPFALAIGGVVALAAAVALVVSGGAGTPSGLRADGGDVPERFAALEAEGGAVRFDDHSQITVTSGTHLESLTNSGSEFRVLLHHGRARFEVEPGGPRRWIIEAGHASVEVIGTVFTVERRDGSVEVEVERGRVMVRSERLPEGLRILGAGERASVRAADAVSGDTVSDDAVSRDTVATRVYEEAHADADSADGVAPVAWAPSAPGDERAPGTGSVAAEAGAAHRSAAELLAEADEARRAGDAERALALLARASEQTGEPEAALASLTRARLLSTLHRASEAVIDLRRALDAGLPPALEESARYRLVSAVAASGDAAGAERAAQDYLRRYPEGSFRGEVLEHSSVLPPTALPTP